MQLLIKTLRGKTIVIDAKPSNTILDIKNIIKERENIPLEKIRLTNHNIADLEDNKTLKNYQIPDNSIIEIKFKTRNDIKYFHDLVNLDNEINSEEKYIMELCNNNFGVEIILENQKGRKFQIYLSLYDTIQKMKDIIAIKESVPQKIQILKFKNVILENNTKRIIDYKIKNGDIIKLSINNKKNIKELNNKDDLIDKEKEKVKDLNTEKLITLNPFSTYENIYRPFILENILLGWIKFIIILYYS